MKAENKLFGPMMFCSIGAMGDSLVVNGIVRYYAALSKHLYTAARPNQVRTLTHLYEDEPNITVIEYESNEQIEAFIRDNGLGRINPPDTYMIPDDKKQLVPLWDEQWYNFYCVPFALRYANFKLPKNLSGSRTLYDRVVKNAKYILTHRTFGRAANTKIDLDYTGWRKSAGLENIENFQIIDIDPSLSDDMLDYVDLIRHAAEIHCVPSSFFCLTDSLFNQTSAKLFYHEIRSETIMRVNNCWNQNAWTFINYANKL